jgi:hypothetical protein
VSSKLDALTLIFARFLSGSQLPGFNPLWIESCVFLVVIEMANAVIEARFRPAEIGG